MHDGVSPQPKNRNTATWAFINLFLFLFLFLAIYINIRFFANKTHHVPPTLPAHSLYGSSSFVKSQTSLSHSFWF